MPEKAKRRNNNEGSIRKRSNGLWEAQYVAGYKPDEKPIRRSIYGKSKKKSKTNCGIRFCSLNGMNTFHRIA